MRTVYYYFIILVLSSYYFIILKYFKILAILSCEFRSLVKSRRIYNPSWDPHLDVPGVINFDQVLWHELPRWRSLRPFHDARRMQFIVEKENSTKVAGGGDRIIKTNGAALFRTLKSTIHTVIYFRIHDASARGFIDTRRNKCGRIWD